jgi:hypothetical protein
MFCRTIVAAVATVQKQPSLTKLLLVQNVSLAYIRFQ